MRCTRCRRPSSRRMACSVDTAPPGGATVVDLMRLEVSTPGRLVELRRLPLDRIEDDPNGLRVGARVTNSALAHHPRVVQGWPALSEALLSGASPQLRDMATLGGNLLQRTRCAYFRDLACRCNRRDPGAGCSALEGYTRMHAILGASERCIAVHPSDMCVALVALDAVVHTRGPSGARSIPVGELHTLPGEHPEIHSRCACATTPIAIPTRTSPGRASRCGSAMRRPPSGSAGAGGPWRRAPSATVGGWWGGAWPPPPIRRAKAPRRRWRGFGSMAARWSRPAPRTSARARTPSCRRSPPTPSPCRSRG